jgi:hypothetical protein
MKHVCPLCDGANDCAVQRGEPLERCWCLKESFPNVLTEGLPPGSACICLPCLARASEQPDQSGTDVPRLIT